MYIRKVTIAAIFICQLTLVPETLMSNNQPLFHLAIKSLKAISENCSGKSTEGLEAYTLAISDLTSVFYQQNVKIAELEIDNVHLKEEIELLKEELSKSGEKVQLRMKREGKLAEYKDWPGFPTPSRKRKKSQQNEDMKQVNTNGVQDAPYVLQRMYRNALHDHKNHPKHVITEKPNSLSDEEKRDYREQNQLSPPNVRRPRRQYGFYNVFEGNPSTQPRRLIHNHGETEFTVADSQDLADICKVTQIEDLPKSEKNQFNRGVKVEDIKLNILKPTEIQEKTVCEDPKVKIDFYEPSDNKKNDKPEFLPTTQKPIENKEQIICEDPSIKKDFYEPSDNKESEPLQNEYIFLNILRPFDESGSEVFEENYPPSEDKEILLHHIVGVNGNGDEEIILLNPPPIMPDIPAAQEEERDRKYHSPAPIPSGEIPMTQGEMIQNGEIPVTKGGMIPFCGIPMIPLTMIPGNEFFGKSCGMFCMRESNQVISNQQQNDPGSVKSSTNSENISSKKEDSCCECPSCNDNTSQTVTIRPECTSKAENSSFEKIVENGCNNFLKEIINQINVNQGDHEGVTALHLAAKRGYVDVMNTLIKAGADINAMDKNNNTALHYCAQGGSVGACKCLLFHGSNVTVQNKEDNATPLHIAIWRGNYEIVEMLLKYHKLFEIIDKFGRSALDLAMEMQDDDIIQLVEKSGIISKNPSMMQNACGRYPSVPVEVTTCPSSSSPTKVSETKRKAKEEGNKLRKVADEKQEVIIKQNLTAKERELFDSSKVNSMQGGRVTKLCAEGLNVNIADLESNSSTPLHVAASIGVKLTILLLIRCGADVNAKDAEGNTPLHLAVNNGKYWVANILLLSKANPYALNNLGETPQKLALNRTEFAIRGLFDSRLLRWYKPDRKLRKDEKAIHKWVKDGYYLGISIKCAEGIDINFKNKDDNLNSALHLAVSIDSKNNEENVLTLLRCGADIHSRDRNGNTPLHLAVMNERADVVIALLMHNADPFIINEEGQTAYHLGQVSNEPLIKDTFTTEAYAWYMGHSLKS